MGGLAIQTRKSPAAIAAACAYANMLERQIRTNFLERHSTAANGMGTPDRSRLSAEATSSKSPPGFEPSGRTAQAASV